jgi:hypothetical protein
VHHGLEYLNNEDIPIDIDSDVEELRSLIPRDKSRKNIVPGGSQKPDVSMCTEPKAKVLLQHYAKARRPTLMRNTSLSQNLHRLLASRMNDFVQ